MRLPVKKVRIDDAANLQTLVAEHIDAIEAGLVVLDSRLLLGQATIDVVALDAHGALVLIAVGLTANEDMLLKAVEAYSWCLEYPESIERLYPSCVLSEERPPRLLFVVERMPDAFHRKIKQLGFPEVDCVEFRLLDVDGVHAAYFESILKLRRHVAPAAPEAAPATPTAAPEPVPPTPENVIALNGATAARATSLKLQKLLNQAAVEAPVNGLRTVERAPAPPREPAAVVSMVNRQAAVAARAERARPVAEPVALREPEPLVSMPEPIVVPAPKPIVLPVPEPVITPDSAPTLVHEPETEPVAATPDRALLDQMQRAMAALDAMTARAVESEIAVSEPEPIAMVEPEPEPAVAAEPVAAAEPVVAPEPEPEPAPIPSLTRTASAAGVPSIETEPVSLRDLPELSPRPTPPAPQPAAPERVSFKDLAAALLGSASSATPAVATPAPAPEPLRLETAAEPNVALVVEDEGAEADDAPAVEAQPDVALTVERLIQSITPPAVAPVAAPAASTPGAAKPAAPAPADNAPAGGALPQEFHGLKFPNDGVLTRQWIDFLSQMSTTK